MCFIEVSAFREPRTELINRSPRAVCANAQDECCFDLDTRIPRHQARYDGPHVRGDYLKIFEGRRACTTHAH